MVLNRVKLKRKISSKGNEQIDKVFLAIISIILGFGLLIVYEATVVYSDTVFGGKYHFLLLQSAWISIGIVGMVIISKLNLDWVQKISPYIFLVAILLLMFILIESPFAPSVYGAKRWFVLNPKPFPELPIIGRISFQPSEFAKLASIIFFASFLSSRKIIEEKGAKPLLKFFVLLGLVCGLILVEPDFTTAFITAVILIIMFFLSEFNLAYFMVSAPILALIAGLYAFSFEYRRERIQTLLNPESIDKMGAGYHIRQIMIALGSGGFFGLGLGHSRQKYAYLPEVMSDSIFAIIGEELGFLGTTLIVTLFCVMILRGMKISHNSNNPFGSLLSAGVIAWISIQALINLGAMSRLLPLTGVPLPLISYGGSSIIFMLWGLGFVLNVSRNGDK